MKKALSGWSFNRVRGWVLVGCLQEYKEKGGGNKAFNASDSAVNNGESEKNLSVGFHHGS
jgi:hypothetical protein